MPRPAQTPSPSPVTRVATAPTRLPPTALAASLLVLLLPVIAALVHALALSSYGGTWMRNIHLALFSLNIIMIPAALYLAAQIRSPSRSLGLLCLILIGACSTPAIYKSSLAAGREALGNAAHRSLPIIEAINRYQNDNHVPPDNLTQLIPGYLPSIPGTGIGVTPHYTYLAGDNLTDYAWKLWVAGLSNPPVSNTRDLASGWGYYPDRPIKTAYIQEKATGQPLPVRPTPQSPPPENPNP